jgi:hypothetical protein
VRLIPSAIVAGEIHQILEPHRAAGEIGKRETDIALALLPGIVSRDQPPLAVLSLPRSGD